MKKKPTHLNDKEWKRVKQIAKAYLHGFPDTAIEVELSIGPFKHHKKDIKDIIKALKKGEEVE